MNRVTIASYVILFGILVAMAQQDGDDAAHVRSMNDALRRGGVKTLADVVLTNGWQAPLIFSLWHIEHRPAPAEPQRSIDRAARDFGYALARELTVASSNLQVIPPNEKLYELTGQLCDIADWCAARGGCGNLLLAHRSLDLASVGLARLSANLEFPLSDCTRLGTRFDPAWFDVAARVQALNRDVGTNLFDMGSSQEKLEKTWMIGCFLFRKRLTDGNLDMSTMAKNLKINEAQKMIANLDFFENKMPFPSGCRTVVGTWNLSNHETLVGGFRLQNIQMAKGLLRFRQEVGCFPDKPYFTDEQIKEINDHISSYAKRGIKVSRMDEGLSPGEAGFSQAWDRREHRNRKEDNLFSVAWMAYHEVRTESFLDEDARDEKRNVNAIKNDERR